MYRISFAHATPTHHISSVTLSRPSLTARLWCQKVDQIATTRLWKIVEQALSRVSACSFDDDDEEKKNVVHFSSHTEIQSRLDWLYGERLRERERRDCVLRYIFVITKWFLDSDFRFVWFLWMKYIFFFKSKKKLSHAARDSILSFLHSLWLSCSARIVILFWMGKIRMSFIFRLKKISKK